MLNCPNCNTVFTGEVVSSDWALNTYYDYIVGTCPECKHRFIWTDVFKYSHTEDIMDVTDNPEYEDM